MPLCTLLRGKPLIRPLHSLRHQHILRYKHALTRFSPSSGAGWHRRAEVVNAYRTDATRERSFRQRACHALIGENPPAEKIKRGDASNPQNSAEWRCEEARNFKNLTHYIPPTAVLFTRYKLLIVVFLPCRTMHRFDHRCHGSRTSLAPKSSSPQTLSLLSFCAAATHDPLLAGGPLFNARGQGLAKPRSYPAFPARSYKINC